MALTLWSDVERGLTNTELDTNFSELAAGCLAQTASDNRPLVKPSLNLDFTKGVLDPRITFTRASTATYFGADGLLKTAGVNEPRFEYDPITKQPKGLLIEEQRTNLLTYSEQFNTSPWFTENTGTILANQAIAPNGTLSADLLYPGSTGVQRWVRLPGWGWNTQSTFSFYAKSAGFRYIGMLNAIGNSPQITFDLQNGTVTNGDTAATVATIVPAPNGFYRCSVSSANGYALVYPTDSPSSWTATANGTSGVYLWGAQLEAGTFPTSYIPTTSTQVTRSSDNAVLSGTNFSSWYKEDEGSLCVEVVKNDSADRFVIGFGDSATNYMGLLYKSGGQNTYIQPVVGPLGTTSFNTGNVVRAAVAYKSADYASVISGNLFTNTSGSRPPIFTSGTLYFGTSPFAPTTIAGCNIRKVAFYPKRLTNTQLQELTK